jgi:hypothetical protein
MNQTGVRSTGSRRHASKNRSFGRHELTAQAYGQEPDACADADQQNRRDDPQLHPALLDRSSEGVRKPRNPTKRASRWIRSSPDPARP